MKLNIKEISIDEFGKSRWDEFVVQNSGNVYAQTVWGDFISTLSIGYPRYFIICAGEHLLGAFSIIDMLLGGSYLVVLPKFILNYLQKVPYLRTFSFHMQPILDDAAVLSADINSAVVVTTIINYLETLAKLEHKNIIPTSLIFSTEKDTALQICNSYGENIDLVVTSRLALSKSLVFPDSVRKISKNKRDSTKIKKVEGVDELAYYKSALHASWKSNHLSVNSALYYVTMYEQLKESVEFYYAYCDQGILAGTGVLVNDKNVIEFSMFSTQLAKDSKLPGGDLLKEYLLAHYKEMGKLSYDFNMYSADSSDEKIQKINFYKLKWGGSSYYGVKITQMNSLMQHIRRFKYALLGK